jgi:hypothetical protein
MKNRKRESVSMSAVKPDCNGELGESVLHSVSYEEDLEVARLEHAFGNAVIKEGEELVVETANIEQKNRLCVNLESMPGEHFEELFEGAEAAGQCDEGVGLFSDECLTGVHGAGNVQFGNAVMGDLEVDENLGDDANDLSVSSQRCFGNGLHKAYIGSTVDEADVASGESAAQIFGSCSIDGVGSVAGGAEDSDIANHRDEDIKCCQQNRTAKEKAADRNSVQHDRPGRSGRT